MENRRRYKTKSTLGEAMSSCKISKYLTSGQLDELVELRDYRMRKDGLTYDDGDNWFQ